MTRFVWLPLGLEMFHQTVDQALPGDQLGILLKNVKKEDVRRGVFVGKPGSLKMFNKFDCQVRRSVRSDSLLTSHFYVDLLLVERRRRPRRTHSEGIRFNHVLSYLWYRCQGYRARRSRNDYAWRRCHHDVVYQQTNGMFLIDTGCDPCSIFLFYFTRSWKRVLDSRYVMQRIKRLAQVSSPIYILIRHRRNWRNSGNELLRASGRTERFCRIICGFSSLSITLYLSAESTFSK